RARPSPSVLRNRTPNGIRTRATAVKGRRPRPLDDGGLRDARRPSVMDLEIIRARSGVCQNRLLRPPPYLGAARWLPRPLRAGYRVRCTLATASAARWLPRPLHA